MIGCLRTHVLKQPTIGLYFEFEIVLKFYNLVAWSQLSYLAHFTGKAAFKVSDQTKVSGIPSESVLSGVSVIILSGTS